MRRLGFSVLLVLLIATTTPLAAMATEATTSRFTAVVSPELELLAGVLSQSDWMKQQGPSGKGNEYFQALKSFFAPYKDHEAIRLANDLTRRGFTYDAPSGFICHLGSLPELELRYEYSAYLVGRAGGRERLEDFRKALKDLAQESDFLSFIAQWQPQFDQWVNSRTLDGGKVVTWLEDFFGKPASAFHLIFAPAMFPGGGYGATINLPDGDMISYQIIRENGSSTQPAFPTGRDLEFLSLHEWGHSFVNPAMERYSSKVKTLNYLFTPVKHAMDSQAYNNVHIFMNEQVLRGITALATSDLYGEAALREIITYEQSRSFYLITEVVEMLEVYRTNRDIYPTFDDFVPELLNRLGKVKSRVPFWYDPIKMLLIGGAMVAIGYAVKRNRKTVPSK